MENYGGENAMQEQPKKTGDYDLEAQLHLLNEYIEYTRMIKEKTRMVLMDLEFRLNYVNETFKNEELKEDIIAYIKHVKNIAIEKLEETTVTQRQFRILKWRAQYLKNASNSSQLNCQLSEIRNSYEELNYEIFSKLETYPEDIAMMMSHLRIKDQGPDPDLEEDIQIVQAKIKRLKKILKYEESRLPSVE